MMHFTDITGLAGVALTLLALTLRLPGIKRLSGKPKLALACMLLIALVIPFGNLSAAEFMRGVLADLSVTTLLLLVVAQREWLRSALGFNELSKAREQGSLLQQEASASKVVSGFTQTLIFVVIAAVVLYPFALGLGMLDPYRWGFGNIGFIAGLLLVALLAWVRHYTLLALSVSLAVLAWSVGWYESNNIWNYLLDPWLAVYAVGALLKRAVTRRTGRKS
ncbi:MAG: hypothetical protein R8K20_08425 [Gallionellaceae bacterium]